MAQQHAIEFLKLARRDPPPSTCVAHGDNSFFQRLVLTNWKLEVAEGEAEFSTTEYSGPTADLPTVLDQLSTRSLFGGGRRLVIIDEADPFISKHRAALEKYASQTHASGVLILLAKTWPSNTRLAKIVADAGLAIDCSVPPPAKLQSWLRAWSTQQYHAQLPAESAELLLASVGPEPGLLDQELAKLSLLSENGVITPDVVERFAGGWRVKTAWSMLDDALAGKAQVALLQLGRLIESGESPIGILAQISSSLRKFLAAARVVEHTESRGGKPKLRDALLATGIKPFAADRSEQQLKHLGRKRASQLGRWLLDTDLALKGPSSAPARAKIALETLILKLATNQR